MMSEGGEASDIYLSKIKAICESFSFDSSIFLSSMFLKRRQPTKNLKKGTKK